MDETNVNKLNGVPNFGHGMPDDGVVIAGVTDVPQVEVVLPEASGETKDAQVETLSEPETIEITEG